MDQDSLKALLRESWSTQFVKDTYACLASRRAFGVDQDGLEALLREGVFHLRTCKLCDDGVVVKGAWSLLRCPAAS